MKVFELSPINGRKSFYGKMRVEEKDNGEAVLYSYNTAVLKRTENGELFRLWTGETQTTINHANAFLRFYGVDGGGLAFWRTIPTERGAK
jgi:hypothetical protein